MAFFDAVRRLLGGEGEQPRVGPSRRSKGADEPGLFAIDDAECCQFAQESVIVGQLISLEEAYARQIPRSGSSAR